MSPPFLLVAALALSQPAAPFKIVVLAGEDSVNVIQQKTAVAPLIEVRDRNNNPVSGAVVTFAIQGGKAAAFQGGAATMTVTTSAAGQAAAAGLTPLTTGAVNISVSAAVQGQVVTAAITQVNVMTAAEAAAAASAGSAGASGGAGGGAAGGGGGISGTTIGIVGGAVAAGAVAATQVGGGENTTTSASQPTYRGSFSMSTTLNFGGCSRQETYSGTLEIVLTATTPAVNGTATIRDGRSALVSGNCPNGPQAGQTGMWGMPAGPVSGSDSSMAFHSQDVVPTVENNGTTIARTFDFTGSLSGPMITGEIHMVWRNSQPTFPLMDMRTPITLTQ